MSALIKNAQDIKHGLDDYDKRRSMQKLELNTVTLERLIDDIIETCSYTENDGSINERLLQSLEDKAEKLSDLMLQHEYQEKHGHDTYIEEEEGA